MTRVTRSPSLSESPRMSATSRVNPGLVDHGFKFALTDVADRVFLAARPVGPQQLLQDRAPRSETTGRCLSNDMRHVDRGTPDWRSHTSGHATPKPRSGWCAVRLGGYLRDLV